MNQVLNCVTIYKHQVITDSLKVAEVFGKNHKNVLRDIEVLLGDRLRSEPISKPNLPIDDNVDSFVKTHFTASYFLDKYQRRQPMYEMTKDGFILLVMGYTGAKAMKFKIAYISAFNEMAKRLQAQSHLTVLQAEQAYFSRYPKDKQIREMALLGYVYWYIAEKIPCHLNTVSRAVKRMTFWGFIETQKLLRAKEGMSAFNRRLRLHRQQTTFDF